MIMSPEAPEKGSITNAFISYKEGSSYTLYTIKKGGKMPTKRKNVSLAHDLEFISKDTGLDVDTITEKTIREFVARYTLEKIRKERS